jgi:hypothetical protein
MLRGLELRAALLLHQCSYDKGTAVAGNAVAQHVDCQ